MKKFKQLTYTKRLILEKALNANLSIKEIAQKLQVHRSTIYREIKRGRYDKIDTNWVEKNLYSPDIAHEKYLKNLKSKGSDFKIGNDFELAEYIENKIINQKYSPEAVLGEIKREKIKFRTSISKTTLYNYIDKGLFLNLTNKNLPSKGKRRNKYRKIKVQSRVNLGESIENRPKNIEKRKEFGHWEMDTVIGKKGVSKNSLLVFTERKTRMEFIIKLERGTTKEVVKSLDFLEKKFKNKFSKIFKSITVDNGVEFSDYKGMEKSFFYNTKRTKIYYCHAYCSHERGSNENQNKLIRRHIPKGICFDKITDEEILEIENWINNYPRKIFNYKTSKMLFDKELKKIV